MDEIALKLGRAVIGAAILVGWFYAGTKAADKGHNKLAWAIAVGPFVIIVLGLFGAFS